MIAVDSKGSYGEGWPHSSGAAIQVKSLWKKYGDTEAVRGISFDVHKGEIFGLIGPDGAGKTSTFQILAGVMEASSGDADVLGRPARQIGRERLSYTGIYALPRPQRRREHSLRRRVAGHRPTR